LTLTPQRNRRGGDGDEDRSGDRSRSEGGRSGSTAGSGISKGVRGRGEGSSANAKGTGAEGYIDAWGDPFISPSKLRKGLKPSALTSIEGYNNTDCMGAGADGVGARSAADSSNIRGGAGLAIGGEGGTVFNTLVWLSTQLLSPFGVRNLAFMHTALCSVYAFMQIVLFGLCCFCNPFDSWGAKWGSVNVFTGAIRLPAMDLAVMFPLWLRPVGIKKLEWGSVLALVSFTGGIHMAMNVSQFNVGVIVETVEKDKTLSSSEKIQVKKVRICVCMYVRLYACILRHASLRVRSARCTYMCVFLPHTYTLPS